MGKRKSKPPVAKRGFVPSESSPSQAQADLQAEIAAVAKQLFRQHPPQMLEVEHEQRIELGLMLDVAIELLQQVHPGTLAQTPKIGIAPSSIKSPCEVPKPIRCYLQVWRLAIGT